jgi:hypothetical protein
MLGNGLPRRVKMLGKRIWRQSLHSNQGYNCSSCRVCYGLKNVSSHFLFYGYETDQLQVYAQLFGFASSFFIFSKVRNKGGIFRLGYAWRFMRFFLVSKGDAQYSVG